ncbi:hypothetical protein PT276_06580 [Orbaceae bacterium ESL0721]|nr:hypothetical protein [Orbaceae bacterium ESL0721]
MVIIADTINNINDRFITEIAEIDKVDEIKEYSPFGSADRYRPDNGGALRLARLFKKTALQPP